jgi:division protein CdvB (Snf7/Vps24/ESCRT-III family)
LRKAKKQLDEMIPRVQQVMRQARQRVLDGNVTGYKQIPALMTELEALAPPRPEVAKRRKVS